MNMDWIRETFFPPSKPNSWSDYWQIARETSVKYTLCLRDILFEVFSVYFIPALYMVVDQVKVVLQVIMDNFQKRLLPVIVSVAEHTKIHCKTFMSFVYETTITTRDLIIHAAIDLSKHLKGYLTIFAHKGKRTWKQIVNRIINVYTYFSHFPKYKLYCLGIILFFMLCCVLMLIQTCKKHRKATKRLKSVSVSKKTNKSVTSVESDDDLANGTSVHSKVLFHKRSVFWTIQLSIVLIYVAVFLISIPWEFIRLYQNEFAKKATITRNGMPDSCLPQGRLTTWHSLKDWFMWQMSWSHDPCEKYHRALLVDPFWEVTPMMVLSSSFTKCVTVPLEVISTGIGRSVRNLFAEIPVTWQPVLMITLIVLLLSSLMFCSYKLCLPLLFRLEPSQRTPVIFRTCRQVRRTRKHNHRKHRHEKYYEDSDDSFENSY